MLTCIKNSDRYSAFCFLVGVPLYRVYQRKSDWKCGGPIEPTTTEPDDNVGKQPADASSIVEKAAALAEKYRSAFHVQTLWKLSVFIWKKALNSLNEFSETMIDVLFA